MRQMGEEINNAIRVAIVVDESKSTIKGSDFIRFTQIRELFLLIDVDDFVLLEDEMKEFISSHKVRIRGHEKINRQILAG